MVDVCSMNIHRQNPTINIMRVTKVKEMGSLAQLPINLCGICSF